jgi:hypothetical protein
LYLSGLIEVEKLKKENSMLNPILIALLIFTFVLIIYWVLVGEKKYKEMLGK